MGRITVMLVALAAGSSTVGGQSYTPAPLVLQLPGGTRAHGMGDAWVAGRGAEVIFYNPAQMPVLRGSTLGVARFGGEATLGTFSTVGPWWKVWIGAGVQFLDYNRRQLPRVFAEPADLGQGGSINGSSLAATVSAAFRFQGFRIGASGKYVEERVFDGHSGNAGFDVGVAREFFRATFALAVQNLGGDLKIENQIGELPTRVTLGVSSPSIRAGTFFDFAFTASVARERDGRIVPAGGAELTYEPVGGWYFVARAGARRVRQNAGEGESPVTFGGSFGLDRFWLDYAFQPYEGPGAAHRVAIRIQ